MNKTLLTLLLFIIVIITGGCTGTGHSESIVVNYNTAGVVVSNDNLTNTVIAEEGKNLTAIGKVVEINFRVSGGDIIVFEDGCTLPTYPARNFIWKIGEVHQIKMEKFLNDYQIKSVEIIEVDDKKQ